MSTYTITLQRANGKKTSDEKIREQVDYIIKRGLSGNRGSTWEHTVKRRPPFQNDDNKWVFTFTVDFKKVRGQKGGDAEYTQWESILAMIEQTGNISRFGDYPWVVLSGGKDEQESLPGDLTTDNPHIIVKTNGPKDDDTEEEAPAEDVPYRTWQDLQIPKELLTDDEAIAHHDLFGKIYGVNPQIRTLLSAIDGGIQSNGQQRDHCVLWGHAGCGKTTTFLALEKLLGPGAILRLDATSTSRAGIEELVFEKYPVGPDGIVMMPPIVACEEIEKADENGLKIWLGALDDRGEIRKNKYRREKLRKVRILFLCTVNNKAKFDNMMGSDGTEAGALSSRCVTEIYFPRPKREVLRRILSDRITHSGGRSDWVDPALDLGYELGYTDPRKFRSLLAGGDRLLDGSYQEDRMAIHEAMKESEK